MSPPEGGILAKIKNLNQIPYQLNIKIMNKTKQITSKETRGTVNNTRPTVYNVMDIAIMAKKQYEHHKYSTMKNPTEYQRGLMKTRCMSEEDLQKRTELDKRWIREYFAPLNDFQPGSNGYSVAKESIRYAVNSAKFFGGDDARANVIESLFKTCQDVELWKIVIACHNLAKTSSVTPTGEMLLDIFNSLT